MTMDEDLSELDRERLVAEVRRLRAGIREHRDSSGHELCWHHPKLWGLLPEQSDPLPTVPEWPEFLRGCVRYRESLDRQLPGAPRSTAGASATDASRSSTEYVRRLRGIVGGDELLQIPSVSVALRDSDGRVLLARHVEGGKWLLPGGAIEPTELPADAAVREMFEETGLVVQLTELIGVFGGPEFVVHYRNGDRTSYVTSVFEAQFTGGRPEPDATEVVEVRFVSEREAEALPKASWLGEVIQAIFHPGQTPRFRAATWKPPAGLT